MSVFLSRTRVWRIALLLLLPLVSCRPEPGAEEPGKPPPVALDAAGPREPERAPSRGRRLILIGLDAADERLIASGIAEGRLPSFARMVKEGVSGPLETHRPILSPMLWTTIATGLTPDRHGVLDFVEPDRAGRPVPITSHSVRVPSFWTILGRSGVTCGVVGWLATHPAEPVRGFLITDRFTIHPFENAPSLPPGATGTRVTPKPAPPATRSAGKTFPPDLFASLQDAIVEPLSIRDEELASVFGAPRDGIPEDAKERRELRVIEAVARTYTQAALRMDERERPDLLAVYFEAIDRLMHLFAAVMPPALPGAPRMRAERYGRAVESFYAAMDARLGRFLDAAGRQGTVIVVSDHGFKMGEERPRHPALRSDVFAAEWHRSPGVILAWGRGVRRGARLEGADIYDVTPTVLAYFGVPASETMRGQVLTDLFEPRFLPPSPPRVPGYEKDTQRPETVGSGTPEERDALENLRALGYIGAGPGETARASARATANLATFFLDEKRYDQAITLYRQALVEDPEDLTALYNLGYAYKGLGSYAKAAECFERLLRARPDYTEARLVLSECYVSLGRTGDALRLLEQREAESRADSAFHNHLGTVLASAGRMEEAAAALEKAIALRPSEASPYLNLARLLSARGDRAGAVRTLERARAAAPGDPRVTKRLSEMKEP